MEDGGFSNALSARLQQLTPEEMAVLDAAITPEVGEILKKVLPELSAVIDSVAGPDEPDPSMQAMPAMEGPALGGPPL